MQKTQRYIPDCCCSVINRSTVSPSFLTLSLSTDPLSPVHLPSPPPSQSSPIHEQVGLEWDPSVDIGRSVSRDDADSSYFSASTGKK